MAVQMVILGDWWGKVEKVVLRKVLIKCGFLANSGGDDGS
jgi:hypothetical protein